MRFKSVVGPVSTPVTLAGAGALALAPPTLICTPLRRPTHNHTTLNTSRTVLYE